MVWSEAVSGYPWPEVTVYRRVRATPEEVTAFYTDFERQGTWVPDLVTNRVVGRTRPWSAHVFYEYEVPGPNERYTVVVEVGRFEAGFQVRWELVAARYMRRLSGHVRVRPHAGGALVEYASRVDPGTLGGMLGSPESVSRRLQATVEALATEVERLRAVEPHTLTGLVRRLETMLEGRTP